MYDWVYAAPSHLNRARMYEALGDTELATAHYRSFVELWKQCDEEFRPLLEEGLERITAAVPS